MVIRSIEDNAIEKNNDINGKVVRNPRLARQILAKGGKDVWLFDIKPDRDNPQKSVYIFENTDKFQEILSSVLDENRQSRKSNEDDLIRKMEEMQKKLDELTKLNEAKE